MKGKGAFMLVLAGWGLIGLMILTTAVEGAPHPADYSSVNNQRDFRSRRGFKTVGLATARGFGKRAPALSTFTSFQDVSEQMMQQDENPNSNPDVFPVDWLVNYLQNKPEVIRYMVDHLLDHNGDGQVTSQELITSLQQRED
ncbi:putative allatotropin precursor [Daphnia sinensis]|uniref:Allatotropin n=1 Tax=Daphnia sinensis TaxID=1820382 RepID=A0AAD5KIA6_9CRUS|nr:putative allatotropin precursor [Daphnia sinensis]